jgi:hypothetical protein
MKYSDFMNKCVNEAKKVEQELPNTNLFYKGFSRDVNGNSVIKISTPNGKPFSIQTNVNLPNTHKLLSVGSQKLSDVELNTIKNEIVNYIQKYGTVKQKSDLKVYTNESKLKYSVDISKMKDSDAENLLIDIENHGKENIDFSLKGSVLHYSDKIKKYVNKFVKENIDSKISAKYNIARYGKTGMEVQSKSGKSLKKFTDNDEDKNWNDAVTWAKKNIKLVQENTMKDFSTFLCEKAIVEGVKKGDVVMYGSDKVKIVDVTSNYVEYEMVGDKIVINGKPQKTMKAPLSRFKSAKPIKEAEGENDPKVDDIIKELINTGWSGDNENQMKAVQLLKGLATSDDPKYNAFMKKLDDFTSGMKED